MSTYAPFAKPLYVMLKPVGAVCNLACDYCYYLEKSRLYQENPKHVMSDELLEKLAPYAADYLFATDGYSAAATLAYNADRPFAVFGEGSFHARQDDFVTDWRAQDGRNVLILRKSAPQAGEYSTYFRRVDVRAFEVLGAHYSSLQVSWARAFGHIVFLLIAFLPAVVIGVAFADLIHEYLFNAITVAAALIIGGLVMLWAERRQHEVTVVP